MNPLVEQLIELVRAHGGIVETADDKIASAGLDSLDINDVLLEVESIYGVQLDCGLFKIYTFREWARYLEELGAHMNVTR
jgi:acyl carrier protein